MEHIVDIILIVVFALTIIFSAKKGFAKIVLDIGATILSFVASYILSRPAAEFLYDKVVKGMIEKSLAEKLSGKTSAADALTQARLLVDAIPEGLINLGDKLGLKVSTLSENLATADFSAGNISEVVTANVLKPIVIILMTAVCGLIIFILASLIFGLLARLINKVFKLPLIKSVNKGLGALLGIVQGVIIILIICSLAYFIGGFVGGEFASLVESSKIIELVNGFNPIITKFGA